MKDCYEVLIFKVYIMTAVRLPRLSRPGVFESIDPKRLFELLHPYADFFANRSVPIEAPDSIDCQAVIREITKADRETPADLLDAICLIDELASTVAIELFARSNTCSYIGDRARWKALSRRHRHSGVAIESRETCPNTCTVSN
jgi:hypothetical protein